jgi:glycosyltransferase involved in cell wall biosynthesis
MVDLAFTATNPCHLYPLAQAASSLPCDVTFYSGYPQWRLPRPHPTHLRTHSGRVLVTYGLLRLPERFRPRSRTLFLWQDRDFDRWAGSKLSKHGFVHAMPGQALETFRKAKALGIRTVLNHATGPSSNWIEIMRGEYERVGLALDRATVYDQLFLEREAKEYELADLHCAASTIVKKQLTARGVSPECIWVIPYGADPKVFYPRPVNSTKQFRIIFAGYVSLRKGVITLLNALQKLRRKEWRLDFYGGIAGEVRQDIAKYSGGTPLYFHGPVSQNDLADKMREASVLVLPSLEEGFGLVVPQALACGIPSIVSDAVGAKDLIKNRDNGSVFPVKDSEALAEELVFWAGQPRRVRGDFSWTQPAETLLKLSEAAAKQRSSGTINR